MQYDTEAKNSLMLTFKFNVDIETVFLGIFTKPCLEKIGLIQ